LPRLWISHWQNMFFKKLVYRVFIVWTDTCLLILCLSKSN
jgi:hypothetical protein